MLQKILRSSSTLVRRWSDLEIWYDMINFQQCRCQGTYFPFWGAKRFCGRFPHHFFKVVFQFLNSFFYFSPTALALKCWAIVKVLVQNDTVVSLGSLQQMAFASCGFLGKRLLVQTSSLEGFPPTVLYIYLPVFFAGVKVCKMFSKWVTSYNRNILIYKGLMLSQA